MPKVVYYVENDENNTLSHYGRLGMKWGQHIFTSGTPSDIKQLKKYRKKAVKKTAKLASIRNKMRSAENTAAVAKALIGAGDTSDYVREVAAYNTKAAQKQRKKFEKYEKKIQPVIDTYMKQLDEASVKRGEEFVKEFLKDDWR